MSAASAAPSAVVFDFAGVLFGWHPPSMLRRLLPELAPHEAAAEALAASLFEDWRGDWLAFDQGLADAAQTAERIARRTGLPLAAVRAAMDEIPRELQPIAGTVALLEGLHAAGTRLFFLSNMPAPYAASLEREHGFLDLFEAGLFSGREHLSKPDAAIFERASARFGLSPAELLFFDDVQANVNAARAAGWRAERFTTPERCALDLAAHRLAWR
jgi:putative hydrolase of the HAD superfamily